MKLETELLNELERAVKYDGWEVSESLMLKLYIHRNLPLLERIRTDGNLNVRQVLDWVYIENFAERWE